MSNSSLRKRFLTKVLPEVSGGCWLWKGACNSHGYGQIWDGQILKRAHRVSYELHHGSIPPGMFVCHVCDVRQCVNPEHLFLGKQVDNVADAIQKCRFGPAKLTPHDVKRIRSSALSSSELAKRHRVTRENIWQIRSGKTWRHLA